METQCMRTKVQKIYKAVCTSIINQDSLNKFKTILFKEINKTYPNATQKEKRQMYLAALSLRNRGDTRANLEGVVRAENYIRRNESIRANKAKLKEQIEDSRAMPVPTIFYLSSHHAKPAKDHEFWEKKLYYDRYWKDAVKGKYTQEEIQEVERYIKSKSLYSVQWSTGFPVYLITRPYCKHYFVPVPTEEVMHSNLRRINKNHPESVMRFKMLSEEDRGKRFQNVRKNVAKSLDALPNKDNLSGWRRYTKI